MAYNAVSQHEHDHSSDGRGSASPPAHENAYKPIPPEHQDLGRGAPWEDAHPDDGSLTNRFGSLMKSMASGNGAYEMVEADEYDEDHTPATPHRAAQQQSSTNATKDTPPPSPVPATPLRTASISRTLPLNSPKPDLQALQGAYVGNIERLEESAERLSSMSSLEEEIQRLKLEQKMSQERPTPSRSSSESGNSSNRPVAAGPQSSSIIEVNNAARSGGYSPGGYITSPKGSIGGGAGYFASSTYITPSVHRLSSLPELHQQDRQHDVGGTATTVSLHLQPPSTRGDRSESVEPDGGLGDEKRHEVVSPDARPVTRDSTATLDQARQAFLEFDGVHRRTDQSASTSRQSSVHRQMTQTNRPGVQQRSVSEQFPPKGMIYYPAPVPMMINLPPKLSKLPPAAELERRRLQGLSQIPAGARNSAAWLAGADVRESREEASNMPPQLRASTFFEQPSTKANIEIKGGSAVDTLDAVLDASAFAPVGAFVDHPFAGRLGSEVYGKAKGEKKARGSDEAPKRSSSFGKSIVRMVSSSGLTTTSRGTRLSSRAPRVDNLGVSSDDEGDEDTHLDTPVERKAHESISPSGDELDDANEEDEDDGSQREEQRSHYEAPTTLLAELQLRKEQQKRRNRQVSSTLPNGMRTTLLEQDAVAQIQRKSRKQKHITLAWEDREAADQANFDDEDIPLGVLYAGEKMVENATRPIGLLEKRDIEENEPLSMRRARIRGEPMKSSAGSTQHQQRASAMQAAGVDEPDEDRPNETLADRIKRLKAEKGSRDDLTSDFAVEVMSQVMPQFEINDVSRKTPDPEETLGQRRQRLKQEAEARQSGGEKLSNLKQRRSMADLLAAHPASGPGSRKPSAERRPHLDHRRSSQMLTPQQQPQQPQQQQFYPQPGLPQMTMMGTFPNMYQMPMANLMAQNQNMFVQNQFQYMNAAGGGMPFLPITTGFGQGQGLPMPNMFPVFQQQQQQQQQQPYHQQQYYQPFTMSTGMGPPLNRNQRDSIDKWRQSIIGSQM